MQTDPGTVTVKFRPKAILARQRCLDKLWGSTAGQNQGPKGPMTKPLWLDTFVHTWRFENTWYTYIHAKISPILSCISPASAPDSVAAPGRTQIDQALRLCSSEVLCFIPEPGRFCTLLLLFITDLDFNNVLNPNHVTAPHNQISGDRLPSFGFTDMEICKARG